ncbi:porin [Rhodoferax aquaticus]|uniref:Porin n=1 Tax=Rhodoferax aquaticus TaxID=2527691 RepID=A0A515ESV0_9BURK|nr:porin [Rhodoferax aquaticus]QDL55746.1 porin [Rhodoferax aquaticus]
MKKSLVALAVLAASGASFAQVTVSGALGMSYQKDRTTPKAVHGLQMTDGHITFTAKEDLGAGYSITAKSEMLLRGRDTALSARDATLNLMTPVGLITMGALDASNSIIGRGWADAPVSLPTGFDGEVIRGGNNVDVIAFNTRLAGIVVGAAYSESGSKDVNDLADAFGAMGALTGGAAGNKIAGGPGGGGGPLQHVSLNASYDNGPISVGMSIGQDSLSISSLQDASAAALFKAGYEGRQSTNISGSYDFGSFKVGAGFSTKTKGWANETVVGLTVPAGAATFGLIYAQKGDDSKSLGDGIRADSAGGTLGAAVASLTTADVKGTAARSGVAVGMDYALSKLTTINVSYGVYDVKDPERVNPVASLRKTASNTNEYRIRLLKAF